jgi:hypothetical protein
MRNSAVLWRFPLFSGTSKRAVRPVRVDADVPTRPAVDESHFARLVAIERKRSELSGAAFVIATIGRGEHTPLEFAEFVPKIADALGRAIREIDTIGWHSSGMSLGILFTEVKVRDTLADLTHAISARLSETLKEAIGPSKLSVECSAFGASGPSEETKPVSTVLAAQVIRPNERAKRAGI